MEKDGDCGSDVSVSWLNKIFVSLLICQDDTEKVMRILAKLPYSFVLVTLTLQSSKDPRAEPDLCLLSFLTGPP